MSTPGDVAATIAGFVVGERVVIRTLLPDGMATDALGEVVARDAATCTVRTPRGDVAVPIAAAVAARRVPPPPTRRAPGGAGHGAISPDPAGSSPD